MFVFEATFPCDSCTVYSSRIDLVFKFEEFFEFVGQGVVWVTDLHWLTAGVGTASQKKILPEYIWECPINLVL